MKKEPAINVADQREERWRQLNETVLPAIAVALERRFNCQFAVSASSRVQSAVRVYLDKEKKGGFHIESDDELAAFLYVVAWRKVKHALKKEHLEDRQPLVSADSAVEARVVAGCYEAIEELLSTVTLSDRQRKYIEGRLESKTREEIGAANGWTTTETDSTARAVQRKLAALRASIGCE